MLLARDMRSDDSLIAEIEQLTAQKIGLYIQPEMRERYAALVREHAGRHGSLAGYRDFLLEKRSEDEWEALARDFTSGETFFFRDHGQFDLLRMQLLPELMARHRTGKTLRLWSAGCASGEEAYSLAMLLDMLIPEQDGWNILILGTDIDSSAIARARKAVYGEWSFRMVPDEIKQRYFKLQSAAGISHSYVLDERIRRRVTFKVANLLGEQDVELHDMDLILCRNIFIYFGQAAVFEVASHLARALRPGGYLMTAHTELLGHAVSELKSRLFAEGVVYQRGEASPAPLVRRVQTRVGARQAKLSEPEPLVKDAPLIKQARALADKGEFEQAEQLCRQILSTDTLDTSACFLLAQLAQVKGDDKLAISLLNKALYLDHRFVAAHLELAALYERAGDMPRAHALRRAALALMRALPADEMIEPYDATAGELAQWLTRWE